MENVFPLPGAAAASQEVGHYIRLGDTGHKILEDLVAEGRFPVDRVVVDASRHKRQAELIAALRSSSGTDVEVILDTKCAELSAAGKFGGTAKDAPWSSLGDGNPLGKEHFSVARDSVVLQQIAEFAVEHQYTAILGTGHFLRDGVSSEWLTCDIASCFQLVEILDTLGAPHIAVDYSLIVPHTLLNDHEHCAKLIGRLADVPFDNLWIRASGFGADARPLTTQRYLRAITQFQQLRKPVIADYLGGLAGMAAVSFGAVSGLCHGIGERLRFDTSSWSSPPKARKSEEFRRPQRMSVPGIQTSLTRTEIELLGRTPAGRRLVGCQDRHCCENGLKTMLENPRRHLIAQSTKALHHIEKVPFENRTRDFLRGTLSDEVRAAGELSRLGVSDDNLHKRLSKNSERIGRLQSALENLAAERENLALRPRQVARRAGNRDNKRNRA